MTDPTPDPSSPPPPPPPSAAPRRSFARRHWGKLTLVALVAGPALAFAAWAAAALTVSYSDGTRTGYNQKLSRKGWLCKTWEGELALSNVPGQAPELFQYSVRDDAVAAQIQRLEGRRVALQYEEHRGVPSSCFGETDYYAVGVRAVDADPLAAPQSGPAGATPAVPPGAAPAPVSPAPPAP
ncbi:hypothetical protein [Roseisolibacter sp. H3M3-2]|uniref:hypothetical protein n=1 Tax=Roseisolibacter sp. H3M3-2 TaxID=3031323 RepID=UPI0023DC615B|nr:hypothetical protein [Roseisolibacter sp. H3M3-2]MDF1504362.1 hypothetical protein [Roseisolibacter sp. H3M3-2]